MAHTIWHTVYACQALSGCPGVARRIFLSSDGLFGSTSDWLVGKPDIFSQQLRAAENRHDGRFAGGKNPGSIYHGDMDPNNPIVRLCVQGMECEKGGRFEDAAELFLSAWNQSADDFERCIAAHYVARHQKNPADTLRWNQRSLDHANAVAYERVREFYPSLYLNMGKAHEDLGNREAAEQFYAMAATVVDCLPDGPYGKIVRDAVDKARIRRAE